MHVAELRVSVSEILNLSSSFTNQTVVSLALITLLVFPFAVADTEYCEETDGDLTAQVDSVTNRISWCVSGSVCPVICQR